MFVLLILPCNCLFCTLIYTHQQTSLLKTFPPQHTLKLNIDFYPLRPPKLHQLAAEAAATISSKAERKKITDLLREHGNKYFIL